MEDQLRQLVELDQRGFILPPHAVPQDYLRRCKQTLQWACTIHENLDQCGEAEVMGAHFTAEQQLPEKVMDQCVASARQTYRINPRWVPAFCTNEHLPWYVGGASFYGSNDDIFQVCFVLRERFRTQSRWMIYDRREIASHEACHVARADFGQNRFEEPLAYAISPSRLRRTLGGMFTSQWQAITLLCSSMLLITGSVADMLGAPSWVRWASGIPLLLSGAGLSAHATITYRQLRHARHFLHPVYGDATQAVLFRCTDEEITDLSNADKGEIAGDEWVEQQQPSLRWDVIQERFGDRNQ